MSKEFGKQQKDFYMIWNRGNTLYNQWAEKLGISYTVLITLYGLDIRGNMTQKEISECYGLAKQTVNSAVRELMAKGYVLLEKNREDGREKTVVLTPAGKRYVTVYFASLYDAEKYAFSVIGKEKFTQMLNTIDLFNTLLDKKFKECKKVNYDDTGNKTEQ